VQGVGKAQRSRSARMQPAKPLSGSILLIIAPTHWSPRNACRAVMSCKQMRTELPANAPETTAAATRRERSGMCSPSTAQRDLPQTARCGAVVRGKGNDKAVPSRRQRITHKLDKGTGRAGRAVPRRRPEPPRKDAPNQPHLVELRFVAVALVAHVSGGRRRGRGRRGGHCAREGSGCVQRRRYEREEDKQRETDRLNED
jgi:hypothetical protein